MSVAVELGRAAAEIDIEREKDVAGRLQHLIKDYVGISVQVNVNKPETLERSAGKAKHVIDKRPRKKT